MQTALSSKGQLIIPADLRRQDDLRTGDRFEIERLDSGQYMLKRIARQPNEGLLEILERCPHHDWFERPESESTDKIRGFE